MRTVVYKLGSFEVVKVVDDLSGIDLVEMPDDEDFMPLEMWNQSSDKERFPTQE